MIPLIIVIVLIIFLVGRFRNAEPSPLSTIALFVGSLGSGKTYLAVANACRVYKNQRRWHKWYKRLPFLKYIYSYCQYPATMYSNIPIKLPCGDGIAKPLTKEHLLMKERLPERCVVVIDEIGSFLSQWEFDNPLVMENVSTFTRLFRHLTEGRMFLTDQVSDSVVKSIRTRVGIINYLTDFHRDFGILPFYKVTTIPMLSVEDTSTRLDADFERYYYGFLPYRFMKGKRYQSRVYKRLYDLPAVKTIDEFDETLYTEYIIDFAVSQSVRKDYKFDREKYKAYLYEPKELPEAAV